MDVAKISQFARTHAPTRVRVLMHQMDEFKGRLEVEWQRAQAMASQQFGANIAVDQTPVIDLGEKPNRAVELARVAGGAILIATAGFFISGALLALFGFGLAVALVAYIFDIRLEPIPVRNPRR